MKCAECKQTPKNRCEKEPHDCTGGTLDLSEYNLPENKPFHSISGQLQAEFGNNLTRLQEVIEFAKRNGYKKIGIAFCIGLVDEAEMLSKVLSQYFEVHSACCRMVGLDKKDFDVPYAKEDSKFESLCNPIGQAKALNRDETDLNLELGLCMGHDILFRKYSEAPVSVFAVKDRVTGHNPLANLYCSYWRKKNIKK